jgi:hypothetical protein
MDVRVDDLWSCRGQRRRACKRRSAGQKLAPVQTSGHARIIAPCDEPALDRIKVTDKGGPSAPEAAGLVKGGTLGEATFCDALQSGSTASLTRAVVPAAADTSRVAGAPAATPWKRRGAITLRTGFVFIDVDKL